MGLLFILSNFLHLLSRLAIFYMGFTHSENLYVHEIRKIEFLGRLKKRESGGTGKIRTCGGWIRSPVPYIPPNYGIGQINARFNIGPG